MNKFEKGDLGKLRERGEITKPHQEIERSARALTDQAKEDALGSLRTLNIESRERVENALERRFYPYVVESAVIASQIGSHKYLNSFVPEIDSFLGAKVGYIVCPDGRISMLSLGDPKVASIYRRLQGLPSTRKSTRSDDEKVVPNDPFLSSAIESELKNRAKKFGDIPKLVQKLGPHIHSTHPHHGCGDRTGEMISAGHTPKIGMRYGGIKEYFETLGDGFEAFENAAQNMGGRGTTIDVVHDAHSQGLIYGLRNAYQKFNENYPLRKNLELLAQNRLILMTELLDDVFRDIIIEKAKERDVNDFINIEDFYDLANNAILIGSIAKEITQEEENNGYQWLPRAIRDGKTDTTIRVAAYHVIRNVTYRVLGNIEPGNHSLERHPEKLIRVGSIGADFNVKNIPFIESTVPGLFQQTDITAVNKLYNLSYNVLLEQGINLEKEARIILVTGNYDPYKYIDEGVREDELTSAAHIVRNNAAWIRAIYKDSIATGETVVIGALHETQTRRLTHIV